MRDEPGWEVDRDPDDGGARGARNPVAAVLGVVAAVVVVGLLVRSPSTTAPAPTPTATPVVVPTTEVTASGEPGSASLIGRGGTWTTVGQRAPIDQINPPEAVWTGRELVVGFGPDVAAYSPDRPPREVWRSLSPHPDGALQVRGVTQVRGAEVYVYGAKTCAGCPWEPSLLALDPNTDTWRRLPDAPGPETPDRAVVTSIGNMLVVVRDRGVDGLQVLAFDPLVEEWRDLDVPPTGPLRWQAVAAGSQLVLVGSLQQPDGTGAVGALRYDLARDAWDDLSAGLRVGDPHEAAAVWTGDAVVLFGGSTRAGPDGQPGLRGSVLDLASGEWTALPPLPEDPLLPAPDALGPLDGLSGLWDGERAVFVGGLTDPLFVAWSPTERTWEVRFPTLPRAGGVAVWTGRQVLLWGGVNRMGPLIDLQAWPTRPAD